MCVYQIRSVVNFVQRGLVGQLDDADIYDVEIYRIEQSARPALAVVKNAFEPIVRKHSLVEQDRRRFYPQNTTVRSVPEQYLSPQASCKQMHWTGDTNWALEKERRQPYFKGRNRNHRRSPTIQLGAI